MREADTAMDPIEDEAALYATALSLSQAAFARRRYAVAYHGLAAAMHAAYDLGDETRLNAVAAVGRQQARWIDEHDPDNELSPRSALNRGSTSLWTSLQREVETRRQMLQGHRLLGHPQPNQEA
jgi:hypothetical protein